MRYSYSALATYQKCPRQFQTKYLDRAWPDEPPSPALIRGRQVHNALEACIKAGAEPPDVWLPDGLLPLLQMGKARAEVALEIHDPFHLIGYIDVLMVNDAQAMVIDWKTGKMKHPDPLQADVYATLIRRVLGIDEVVFSWVGVDAGRTVTSAPDSRAEQRVTEIIRDIETNTHHPPVESWLCRYCPLTWCKHNRST